MKTIIEEAIESFTMNHYDRCVNDNCHHAELIQRAKDYEKLIERNIGAEIAEKLDHVRNDWLIREEIQEGSLASFVDLVFDTAIKFIHK